MADQINHQNIKGAAPLRTLQTIGWQLSNNIYPSVCNEGVVIPGKRLPPYNHPDTETSYVTLSQQSQGPNRSPARPWQRSERWQRQARQSRSWATGQAASFICEPLKRAYLAQLEEVKAAYRCSNAWEEDNGIWIIAESLLLEGSAVTATIVVKIPFSPLFPPAAWAFWNGIHWIGPRHTNYPDGSICAFEPSDRTWLPGDSLVELLDLYTLWCVRHLYLKELGVWPGDQVIHSAAERWSEGLPNEQCGCGSQALYKDCCQMHDRGSGLLESSIAFITRGGAVRRAPPDKIFSILRGMRG